jgi:sulfate transport system ATP-binding protein
MNRGQIEQVGSPREVFEHPATPFVMDFLGRVNVFQGRVQNGRAFLGEAEVPCPDYPHHEERAAAVYVRPHELDIEHAAESPASLTATVLHVHPVGAVVRVQLRVGTDENDLNVELSPERYSQLDLKNGDRVFVAPRRARVFVPDYSI